MRKLPPDRKRYLIQQNRFLKGGVASGSPSQPSHTVSLGPARASSILPALMPQLTGEFGLMRRLSSSWNASPAVENIPVAPEPPDAINNGSEMSLVEPQTTGSLWSSWWSTSSDDAGPSQKPVPSREEKTPSYYVEAIERSRSRNSKLMKLLISLRVHLSTAKLPWVVAFIEDDNGLDILGDLLKTIVGRGDKAKAATETEDGILLEIIKCFRVLLNTEVLSVIKIDASSSN